MARSTLMLPTYSLVWCVLQAWALLRDFNKHDVRGTSSAMTADRQQRRSLKDALLCIRRHAAPDVAWDPADPDLLLGILATDIRLGVRALRDWTQAMEVTFTLPDSRVRCGNTHFLWNALYDIA